jgi:pyruvate dehydrogenase E1 component beta subunit
VVLEQKSAPSSWNVSEKLKINSFIFLIILAEAFDYLDAPVERLTGADVPMPYAVNLEKAATPQKENIINAVKRIMNRKI